MSDEVLSCVDKGTCELLSKEDKQALLSEIENTSSPASEILNEDASPELTIKEKIQRLMKLGAF